jgi:hypothetical protein
MTCTVLGRNSRSRDPRRGLSRPACTARAQSHVIGVVLMLGITVVALAALTAGVGSTVDSGVARADADRAADAFSALDAVSRTGPGTERVAFADGSIETVERELRVLDDDGVVRRIDVNALVFTAGNREVRYLAGAVVRGRPDRAWLVEDPPIATGSSTVLVGAPELDADEQIAIDGSGHVDLAVDVSHDRETLPADAYRVAIETETVDAWTRYFERLGATVETRDFDGDGVESVVAAFPGQRTLHLVVHVLELEVDG